MSERRDGRHHYDTASTESLDIIRSNECEARPGLATSRFQALWNEIERLRALSERRDGWMDIASAPKDGTRILLYERIFGIRVGSWLSDEYFAGWSKDGTKLGFNGGATHWMPLPEPPPSDQRGENSG